MRNVILAVSAVAFMSLAAPAFSAPCYGEAMRCAQDQGWKPQTRQQAPASVEQVTPTQPRRAKHRRHRPSNG